MMLALCFFTLCAMLCMPQAAAQSARDALRTWGLDVVPSLFPYMVFCRFMITRLRRLPGTPAAAALGLLGGSPSGAAMTAVHAARLSRHQVCCLCALTGTISPMFLLNTLQSWGFHALFCRALLFSHLFGACFAMAVVFLSTRHKQNQENISTGFAASDENPITQSVQAILSVGGCIVFFSVLAGTLRTLCPFLTVQRSALLHALLEIAGGMQEITRTVLIDRPMLLAALCGFGGLSILCQNLIFLRPLGISLGHLMVFAFLRAAGAVSGMWICLLII